MFDVTSGVKGHKSAVASRRGSHELDMLGISGGRKCNSESVTLLKCVCVCVVGNTNTEPETLME